MPTPLAPCWSEHAAIKQDHSRWSQLELVKPNAYQITEDDDGNVAWLELRNCTCGSTLAVLVLMRDGQEKAA